MFSRLWRAEICEVCILRHFRMGGIEEFSISFDGTNILLVCAVECFVSSRNHLLSTLRVLFVSCSINGSLVHDGRLRLSRSRSRGSSSRRTAVAIAEAVTWKAPDVSLQPRVKRQNVHLEQFVKDWFIDFADLQKRSWTCLRSFHEAQRLSPDVFSSAHSESTRRWKHSRDEDERRTCVCPTTLYAHLSLLSEVVAKEELCELGIVYILSSIFFETANAPQQVLESSHGHHCMCSKVPTVITLSVSAGFSVLQ